MTAQPPQRNATRFNPLLAVLGLAVLLLLIFFASKLRHAPAPAPAHLVSLAIIPFRNTGPGPANHFTGYSLAATVITKLEYVSSLVVRPSSSVVGDQDQNEPDLETIAANLKVDRILSGTYKQENQTLRLHLQLLDAAQHRPIWTTDLDFSGEPLPAVADQLTAKLISKLGLTLSPSEQSNVHSVQPLDPKTFAFAPSSDLIDSQLSSARDLIHSGKAEQAVPLLVKVLRLNKNNPQAHWELGEAFRYGGLLSQSLGETLLARQLDPTVNPGLPAVITYLYLERYRDFVSTLPADQSPGTLFYRGLAEYHQGKLNEAAKHFDDAFTLNPKLVQSIVGEAISSSIKHDEMRGLRLLAQTERQTDDGEILYQIAQAYTILHENGSALRMLRLAVDHGFFPYPYFQTDPLMASLRSDATYLEIANIARKRHDQFESQI